MRGISGIQNSPECVGIKPAPPQQWRTLARDFSSLMANQVREKREVVEEGGFIVSRDFKEGLGFRLHRSDGQPGERRAWVGLCEDEGGPDRWDRAISGRERSQVPILGGAGKMGRGPLAGPGRLVPHGLLSPFFLFLLFPFFVFYFLLYLLQNDFKTTQTKTKIF
jgi:hypothetical protein